MALSALGHPVAFTMPLHGPIRINLSVFPGDDVLITPHSAALGPRLSSRKMCVGAILQPPVLDVRPIPRFVHIPAFGRIAIEAPSGFGNVSECEHGRVQRRPYEHDEEL
jgi:hypothetical protein